MALTVQSFAYAVNRHLTCSFRLTVSFQHFTSLRKAFKRPFQPDLTLQVAQLALSNLGLMTIPFADMACYTGLKRSLPIRSSISPKISFVAITSASFKTSLLRDGVPISSPFRTPDFKPFVAILRWIPLMERHTTDACNY